MEEKKSNISVVNENEEPKEDKKLSYEQLNNICSQLYQENQNLTRQIQQLNISNMFRRLDYLFKVLEFEAVIKDPEFINNCVSEIRDAMTIPQTDEDKEEE